MERVSDLWAAVDEYLAGLLAPDDPALTGALERSPGAGLPGRFLELVGEEPRLVATALQTVGSKGSDGFALALVTS